MQHTSVIRQQRQRHFHGPLAVSSGKKQATGSNTSTWAIVCDFESFGSNTFQYPKHTCLPLLRPPLRRAPCQLHQARPHVPRSTPRVRRAIRARPSTRCGRMSRRTGAFQTSNLALYLKTAPRSTGPRRCTRTCARLLWLC